MLWRCILLIICMWPNPARAQSFTDIPLLDGIAELPAHSDKAIYRVKGEAHWVWDRLIMPEDIDGQAWEKVPFPKSWRTLPPLQNHTKGKATYRIRLRFPMTAIGTVWAIKFPRSLGAIKIWVEGFELPNASQVAEDPSAVRQHSNNMIHYFRINREQVDLVIQNVNVEIHSGGFDWDFLVAPAIALQEMLLRLSLLDAAIIGVLFFSAVYHIWLYSFRRQWLPYLALGLFFLMAMIRISVIGAARWASGFELPETLVWKVEILAYYALVELSLLNVHLIYSQYGFRRWNTFLYIATGLITVATVFLPVHMGYEIMSVFHILTLLVFGTMMQMVILAMIRRHPGSTVFFLGMIVAIACSILDLMHVLDVIQIPFFTLGPGLMVFALLACIFQAFRFERIFQVLEVQTQSISSLHKHLESQATALNHEVSKRTHELDAILQHTDAGVVIFIETANGLALSPYVSKAALRFLDTREPCWATFEDFLQRSELHPNQISQATEALRASLASHSDFFDVNAGLLPHELKIKGADETFRLYLCSWIPQVEDNTVTSLLLIMIDVTEETSRSHHSHLRHQQQKRMLQLISQEPSRLSIFIHEAMALVQRMNEALQEHEGAADAPDRSLLMRDLHTLKGLARTVGFSFLAEAAHQAEDEILKGGTLSGGRVRETLQPVQRCLNLYINDFQLITHQSVDDALVRQPSFIDAISSASQKIAQSLSYADWQEQWQQFKNRYFVSLEQLVDSLRFNMKEMASKLGKPEPMIRLAGDNCRFKRSWAGVLSGSLIHLLRNAIDHGIESPEARVAAGKPLAGVIVIEALFLPDRDLLQIDVLDDGMGLDLRGIYERAQGMHLIESGQQLSDEETAGFIFHSGFSTRATASEISGRGIGMDAVRSTILQAGGELHIIWQTERNAAGYRPCRWRIHLPGRMAMRELT